MKTFIGLSKNKNTLIDTDNSMLISRGKWGGGGGVVDGKAEINGDGRRLNLGW